MGKVTDKILANADSSNATYPRFQSYDANLTIKELIKDADYGITETAIRPLIKTNRTGGMGSTGVSDNGDSITLNISEPKIPDFIKKPEPPVKRGRGRPRKDAVRS